MQTLLDRQRAAITDPLSPLSAPHATEPYADANDRLRHLDEMQRLSQETECPLQVITPIYEGTLARLKADATIHDYLPILVAKGVKNALKDMARRH